MLDDRLKKMRKEAGYTQKELSAVSGVSRATIARIETGYVTQVRPDTLTALAIPLKVSMDQLLDFTPAPATVEVQVIDPYLNQLVDEYRGLSPERQSQLRDFLRWLSDQADGNSDNTSSRRHTEQETDDDGG